LEKLLAGLAAALFGVGLAAGPSAPDDKVAFSFEDPEIIESSGLAVEDGLFATINDSGDTGRVFIVDPADGRTVAVTSWDDAPEDAEAMSVLPGGDVLVGDIGDNLAGRDSVELVRLPFGTDGTVEPTTYELTYPDGSHDAEALLVHPRSGQVLVVAKEFIGQLYAAPRELSADGSNELEQIGEDLLPIATDGAFFPDGKHFVLRGYGDAAFYRWPSLEPVGEIELPEQEQGEGIAVDDDGTVYLSSEGVHSDVLELRLPRSLRAELEGAEPGRDDDAGSNTVSGDDADGADDGDADDGDDADGNLADDDPPAQDVTRPFLPWAIGGIAGVVILVVLVRSLRPR
jgi:hypothetical protein